MPLTSTEPNILKTNDVPTVGITIVVVLVALLSTIGYIAYLRKRNITKRKGNLCALSSTMNLPLFSFQIVPGRIEKIAEVFYTIFSFF